MKAYIENHPTYKRARMCYGLKSTRGLANRARWLKLPTWPIAWWSTSKSIQDHHMRSERDKCAAFAEARKSFPDAKRSLHDKEFRRNYLRRMQSAFRALNRTRTDTLDQCLKSVEFLHSDKRKNAIRNYELEMAIAKAKHGSFIAECPGLKAIPFTCEEKLMKDCSIKICRRGNDWSVEATTTPSRLHHVDAQTEWRNGKAVGYTRATNDNYIRSFGIIDPQDNRQLHCILHETKYDNKLSEGYIFEIDNLGIKVIDVSTRADYHPTANQLIADPACASIINCLRANYLTRQKAKSEISMEGKLSDLYICVKDSLRAGNCLAGTLSFAGQNNIDPRKHYRADEIMDRYGDNPRVVMCVKSAAKLYREEMAAGFSLLEKHNGPWS